MYLTLPDVRLWFDVSGPSVIPEDDHVVERPTIIAVHGGPGLDHVGLKVHLGAVAERVQVVYFDQRGHGRSDYGAPGNWNLATWASDLKGVCDILGVERPVVLGSSFGGFVTLAYAAMYPDHPGGIILANTTGGRTDYDRSIEIFRRLGGDDAADVATRDFAEISEESAAEFNRVCLPLFSARPGYVEESQQSMSRAIHTTEVNLHYWRNEAPRFDPWELLAEVTCPVLLLAGVDDPICPYEVVQELARGLVNAEATLVALPNARHAIFRDQPELASEAVHAFINAGEHPSSRGCL